MCFIITLICQEGLDFSFINATVQYNHLHFDKPAVKFRKGLLTDMQLNR